jgi:hypothetical protein
VSVQPWQIVPKPSISGEAALQYFPEEAVTFFHLDSWKKSKVFAPVPMRAVLELNWQRYSIAPTYQWMV